MSANAPTSVIPTTQPTHNAITTERWSRLRLMEGVPTDKLDAEGFPWLLSPLTSRAAMSKSTSDSMSLAKTSYATLTKWNSSSTLSVLFSRESSPSPATSPNTARTSESRPDSKPGQFKYVFLPVHAAVTLSLVTTLLCHENTRQRRGQRSCHAIILIFDAESELMSSMVVFEGVTPL